MTQRVRRTGLGTRTLKITLAVTAALLAGAAPSSAAVSTGTVVVAAPGSSVWNVGTSTVTVEPGTTVVQLATQLAASDGSLQTRSVVDAGGAAKTAGAVAAGDRLLVTAADGRTQGSYAL